MNIMATTLPARAASRHLPSSDHRPAMAKADLRIPESRDFRAEIGRCVDRARQVCGWNLDQLADAVHHDARQVARWISGAERAQFDALFAVEQLRGPLVIALASLADDIRITTTITIEQRRAM